jgi:DNA polymerase III subunit delta'
MTLYPLIGNHTAGTLIERMLQQQCVPNTLLFAGPEGVGKGLFALNLVVGLMGQDHAKKIERGSHPDLHMYHPEGKSGLHPISVIRQLIEEMHLPPFEAPCKAFIIHDAERMLPSASNALLKTFEEPSSDSYIILLSSEPEALLPTIVSRCRKLSFFSIEEDLMAQYIEQKWNKVPEEARRIAFLSQGSAGKACALVKNGSDPKKELLLKLLSDHKNYPVLLSTLAKLEELLDPPQDAPEGEIQADWMKQVDAVFEEIFYWYRDLHLLSKNCDPKHLFYREYLSELEKHRENIPSLETVFDLIAESRLAVQRNIKLRTSLEHLFLSL